VVEIRWDFGPTFSIFKELEMVRRKKEDLSKCPRCGGTLLILVSATVSYKITQNGKKSKKTRAIHKESDSPQIRCDSCQYPEGEATEDYFRFIDKLSIKN
jgi:ssDNA-binding Zn-finger/Zn-ribbon topoisomerase 1